MFTVIVGVTGGIAAYKTCEIVSRLNGLGCDVWVAMTKSAQKFVSPLTFRTLSGNPVITDLFADELSGIPVPHISLTEKADLIIIAPATANIIGKIAYGIADDPLSTIVMSAKCEKLIAPAMNTNMWDNPAVKENSVKLKKLGFKFIGPCEGKLACGDLGIGRMAEPRDIIEKAKELLSIKEDLKGKTVLVTAGGTQEEIDTVRFISNRSSGKMGYAVASEAKKRGADVILISGPTNLEAPKGVKLVSVRSAKEMRDQVMKHEKGSDAIVMAAAVADYEPKVKSQKSKVKKTDQNLKLELEPTQDILQELGNKKNGHYLVGFALETEELEKNAKLKLKKKNLDLIVANTPSAFEKDESEVELIDRKGRIEKISRSPKAKIANKILDHVIR